MPYVIVFFDKTESDALRSKLRDAHIAYIDENKERIIAGGGLLNDEGTAGIGGVIIVDTDDRAEAEGFAAADPFFVGGLYGDYRISRWRRAIFDGRRVSG